MSCAHHMRADFHGPHRVYVPSLPFYGSEPLVPRSGYQHLTSLCFPTGLAAITLAVRVAEDLVVPSFIMCPWYC